MEWILSWLVLVSFFFNAPKKKGEEEEEISKTNQQDEGSLGDANIKHVKKKEKSMYLLS